MLPIKLTTPNPIRISVHIKKGRSAGHTTLNHKLRPSNEDLNVSWGYVIILVIIKIKIRALIYTEKFFLIKASPEQNIS